MAYLPLDAGRLDKRIVLQFAVETDDARGGGGRVTDYVDTATLWASIDPGSGREFVDARQLTPDLSHIVKMRYRAGVTPKHRIRYVGNGAVRIFSIVSVADPLERHEQLILMCSEIVPV